MIHPLIRGASVLAGVLLLTRVGHAVARGGAQPILAVFGFLALLLMLPLFAGRRRPGHDDLDRLTENVLRFRTAMFVCFGAAVIIYAMVASAPHAGWDLLNRVASLGAAFWLVGLMMMFFTAYFSSRRALLLSDETPEQ